ncbi:MAG: hypothetical protein E6K47_16345, partial [Gammaproteobacteria bacterium]
MRTLWSNFMRMASAPSYLEALSETKPLSRRQVEIPRTRRMEPLMHARRFALLTFASFAFAGVAVAKDAGNATDAINPHSPRYGHPYRHGVHPTRETHEKMKAWEAANRGVVRPADAEHKERGSVGATEPAIAAA